MLRALTIRNLRTATLSSLKLALTAPSRARLEYALTRARSLGGSA